MSVSTCLRSFAPKRNLFPKQNTCLYWKSIKLMCVIKVSAVVWHATLYLITPWQYLPRLSIRRSLACCSISCHAWAVSAEALHAVLISYHAVAVSAEAWNAVLISYHALAVSAKAWYSILYLFTSWHKLAVSAEAWHSILYLIEPLQYLLRLGMLF